MLCWVALAHNGNPLHKQQQQPQPVLTKNITAKEAAHIARDYEPHMFCGEFLCLYKV